MNKNYAIKTLLYSNINSLLVNVLYFVDNVIFVFIFFTLIQALIRRFSYSCFNILSTKSCYIMYHTIFVLHTCQIYIHCRALNLFTWCATKICNSPFDSIGNRQRKEREKDLSSSRPVSLAMMRELTISRSCVKCSVAWPTEIEGLNYTTGLQLKINWASLSWPFRRLCRYTAPPRKTTRG